jgi:hypothetical protein
MSRGHVVIDAVSFLLSVYVNRLWPCVDAHQRLHQLKLKMKLFTTCTVRAGLTQIPYAPVVVSRPSQLCHTWNLQVMARPLITYIQPLQGCSGILLPPRGVWGAGQWQRALRSMRRCIVWRRGERPCGI